VTLGSAARWEKVRPSLWPDRATRSRERFAALHVRVGRLRRSGGWLGPRRGQHVRCVRQGPTTLRGRRSLEAELNRRNGEQDPSPPASADEQSGSSTRTSRGGTPGPAPGVAATRSTRRPAAGRGGARCPRASVPVCLPPPCLAGPSSPKRTPCIQASRAHARITGLRHRGGHLLSEALARRATSGERLGCEGSSVRGWSPWLPASATPGVC